MNRPLGTAVIGAALAVLATAPPADAAWSVGGEAVSAPMDSARVEARLDRRAADGVATTEGTSSSAPQVLLAAGSAALVDVVNRSSVAAPLEVNVAVDSIVDLADSVTVCTVPWTMTRGLLGSTTTTCPGQESLVGGSVVVVAGSSSRTWRTSSLRADERMHLRVGGGIALVSRTTVTATPKPVARDRSSG